ncbi:DUF6600 domain-containing protein, partial [Legionella anisa]|uniref:DUF6600 domain-containing protein n=1 Tax=Legionella anisa TaxID=28082 RepID=UPI00197CF5A0
MKKNMMSCIYSVFIFLFFIFGPAYAEDGGEPPRVARLSSINGSASLLPGGETQWVKGIVNRPLIPGDRIWSSNKSFLELQMGSTTVRMGNQTSLKILNLNQKMTQLQLSSGTLIVKVMRLNPGQTIEISTPILAFRITKPGYYRIFVNTQAKITLISVIKGKGAVYGSKGSYIVNQGRSYPLGVNLKLFKPTGIPAPDNFERWSRLRDRMGKGITQYVSTEMIGEEDLPLHGTWKKTPKYGQVWIPNKVSPNWAPYRTGQWMWIRQWGWTWVDKEPWGFAPFHYGRWAYLERRWCWVPGPRYAQPVYAPALVVFVGGNNFNLRLSTGAPGIAWFPLAPGEIYIPPATLGRNYFINVNTSNTQINNTYVNNIYINRNTNIFYQNVNVAPAITAVPTQTFVNSQPVSQALVTVPSQEIQQAPKTPIATVAPDMSSVLGASSAESQPPKEILDQSGVVTVTPPAPPVPFSKEKKLLEKNPGSPLSAQETQSLKPTESAEKLDVVNPTQTSTPINEEIINQAPTVPDPTLIKPQEQVQPQPQEQVQPQPQEQVQ